MRLPTVKNTSCSTCPCKRSSTREPPDAAGRDGRCVRCAAPLSWDSTANRNSPARLRTAGSTLARGIRTHQQPDLPVAQPAFDLLFRARHPLAAGIPPSAAGDGEKKKEKKKQLFTA